jgi:hypothetical protein
LAQSAQDPQPLTMPPNSPMTAKQPVPTVSSAGVAIDMTCKVYPLSELGDDPSLGKWVVDTIPEVIQPGSWNSTESMESRRRINYHAPSRILVVYHTAAVHAKVDAFLNDLKKALPQDNSRATANARKLPLMDRQVMQAGAASSAGGANFSGQFTATPVTVNPSEPVAPQASGYPVAAPLKQPKHLFHFIIRYEGEGLIDANVVKFAKALSSENSTRNTTQPSYSTTHPGYGPPADSTGGSTRANSEPAAKSTDGSPSSAPPQPQASPAQPPAASPMPSSSNFAAPAR